MSTEKKPIRVAIACGGTGGHLFPGLAVAEALQERGHEILLFVSEKGIDTTALKAHPNFRFEKLPSIGMPSVLSPAFIRFLRRSWESLSFCRGVYRKFRPDVVLGMGGFTSTAPVLAGRLQKLPTLIHESNAIPGRANKMAARFASRILLGFEVCEQYFPGHECKVTGTPVRRNLGSPMDKAAARELLRLDPNLPTILVMGGSQGAAGINQLMFKSVPMLKGGKLQIIHLTGERDDQLAAANYQREEIPHYVSPFHHKMEEVLSAADIVVSRAGAASLSELAKFALPAILVPYPYATDDHQSANARVFVEAGAAELQSESATNPDAFASLILDLLSNTARREKMSEAMRKLVPSNASVNVADEIERAVRKK